jgi:hypothetical protein
VADLAGQFEVTRGLGQGDVKAAVLLCVAVVGFGIIAGVPVVQDFKVAELIGRYNAYGSFQGGRLQL